MQYELRAKKGYGIQQVLIVSIACVNGDHVEYISVEDDARVCLNFLTANDHEGSSVRVIQTDRFPRASINVISEGSVVIGENVYEFLKGFAP